MTTAVSPVIAEFLNGTIQAVTNIIPIPISLEKPSLLKSRVVQSEFGVLLGIAGSVPGQLFIHASKQVFASIATNMYGMALSDEMLESFIGELGNMVGGNLCTNVSATGIHIEITPPAVLVGETKLTGFSAPAFLIPLSIMDVGNLDIILILSNE